MTKSELINEILSEWAYRVDDGQPNPNNKKHLAELSMVLSEMGLSDIKNELFQNIREAESKQFTNPILNKEIPYTAKDGSKKTGIVGNLLRLPKDNPGRIEAEKMLPANPDEKDAAMQDLGSEKDGKSTGGEKATAEKPKDGEKPEVGDEQPKEDPIKAAQAMFDPKADPAMGARLDREKAAADKIVQKDKEDSEEEKRTQASTNDENPAADFKPIDAKEVNSEMPQADPETFGGGSDIPDGIQPDELNQFNTDINKVAQIVAKAKENNQPIPDINLCDITVPGTNLYCDDNLGIPRDEMPQFKGKATTGSRAENMPTDDAGEVDTEPVFRKMLDDKGIKVLQTEVPADKLKATQKDLVGAKVIGMMGALEKDPQHPKITAPIYVSRDGYVIDGHHRWAAIVAYNAQHPDSQIPMKTTVLDMDIKDAIPMANKFAEDMGIAAKKADANVEAPKTDEKLPEPKPADEQPGGIVYNVGGNYYSDTPNGPAQYIKTESVLEKILVEGDESYINFLFEANVTKKTSKGATIKLKTIDPKNQKKATVAAKAKKEKPSAGEPQTTNPYAQPGQQIKEPKQVKNLMANDTKKVLNALHKTKEQEQAEKEAAKKAGKKLGVGAGTAASRAGECAVVSGGKMLTDAIAKGIPFDKAIKSVEDMLRKVANNSDTLLDNEWVNSAITTLTYINNSIGFNKISQFTWDTDEGRAVVGSEGHGTSSDCFMLLKDGTRLGLSLKKDLNVFVFSGGMGDMMKDLESQGMQGLPTLEDYKNRRSEEMSKIDVFARNKKTHDEFCKDFNNLRLHPDTRFEAKGLSNRLASIQKNTKKPLKSLSCDEFINSVVSNPKGDNIKILADMCKTSNVPALKQIYKNTRGLDREMTDKVTTNFIDPKNKAVVNELVRRETHIDDILFPNNEHLDKLMVVYGEDPAIEMKKENLIGLLGINAEYAAYEKEKNPAKKAELKKGLDEKINSQIKVTNKGGVMSVGIDIGKSIIPIFEARVRTRGIGNAPTFEMPQSRFGGLAFKNGTTNFREWKDPKDRIDVVTSMSKELMDDMDDLDLTDKLTQTEILGRIARLKAILPDGAKNKTLNKALLQLKAAGIEPK
jgi:hypothetical protein